MLQLGKNLQRLGFWKNKTQKRKGSVRDFIAKMSRGLMLPISMLPIAGVFLGVGASIATNAGNSEGLKIFGNFLSIPGGAIFGALPLLFAIAIAITFTGDSGPAALATIIAFLVFSSLQAALITPVNENGDLVGYNLLFYLPGSLGRYSPVGKNVSAGLQTSLFQNVLGFNQLSSSVFGGILVGFVTAFLYNRYKNIKLPTVIGFFSGIRFIPILTFLAFFPITLVFIMLWPLIGTFLYLLGNALGNALGFNSFIFGFIERSLVPTGLHHAFYSPLWYTSAGGSVDFTQAAVIARGDAEYAVSDSTNVGLISWQKLIENLNPQGQAVAGSTNNPNTVGGDQTLFAHLNKNLLGREVFIRPVNKMNMSYVLMGRSMEKTTLSWTDLTAPFNLGGREIKGANGFLGVNIGQYLQGKYVFMITGLPAASFAMIQAAPKENRKAASSVLISAGFTSFLTGITEPIEFTFLFLAPWLFWGVHAFFCALAFGLMNWIGLITLAAGAPNLAPHIGQSFSGGIIDWIIYGGIQIQYGSNAWWSWVFGAMYAPIYFFLFYWLIRKFNVATPGREGNVATLYKKVDYLAKKSALNLGLKEDQFLALNLINAHGGFDNIQNVEACITKLRINVVNKDLVNKDRITALGAKGVISPTPQAVFSVFGVEADLIKNNMKELITNIANDPTLKEEYGKLSGDLKTASKAASKETKTNNLAKEHLIVRSPVDGIIVSRSTIPDPAFKNNLVGQGIALIPKKSDFIAPIVGKLSLVFETGHAYTFESACGSQIMVHIGIDSLNLKDKNNKVIQPFTAFVKTDDHVQTNSKIVKVDLEKLAFAKSNITPIIILNETIANREVKIIAQTGLVKQGDVLFEVLPAKK